MKMRRPVAILETHPELRDHFTLTDMLAFIQVFNGIQAEMTIQDMETDILQIMGQYQRSAIVAVIVVKAKRMNDAVQWRHDLGPGRTPDIDTQVQTTGLLSRIEMFAARIQRTVFAITPDAIPGPMLPQGLFDPDSKAFGIRDLIRAEVLIARRKVKRIQSCSCACSTACMDAAFVIGCCKLLIFIQGAAGRPLAVLYFDQRLLDGLVQLRVPAADLVLESIDHLYIGCDARHLYVLAIQCITAP